MATSERSNANILEQLRNGTAKFELVSSPVRSISGSNPFAGLSSFFQGTTTSRFFARIAPPAEHTHTPALKKIEQYSVQKVAGDGRCMFRALVKGMALNKGVRLSPRQETQNADELRMAVKEVICDDEKERHKYQEAIVAITVEDSLKRYCQRIKRSDFWGGESELLVLSKLCHQPIVVYIPGHEHRGNVSASGFIPIAEYGAEFCKGSGKGSPKRAVVRLLYSGSNHYDLLESGFSVIEILTNKELHKDGDHPPAVMGNLVLVIHQEGIRTQHREPRRTKADDPPHKMPPKYLFIHDWK
ncbi:hypothetical protein V2J09_006643 [Rumex salicifolius]